jgi:hypothetical protein
MISRITSAAASAARFTAARKVRALFTVAALALAAGMLAGGGNSRSRHTDWAAPRPLFITACSCVFVLALIAAVVTAVVMAAGRLAAWHRDCREEGVSPARAAAECAARMLRAQAWELAVAALLAGSVAAWANIPGPGRYPDWHSARAVTTEALSLAALAVVVARVALAVAGVVGVICARRRMAASPGTHPPSAQDGGRPPRPAPETGTGKKEDQMKIRTGNHPGGAR